MKLSRPGTGIFVRIATLWLLAAGGAQAHIPLTPDILNDAFAEIAKAQIRANTAQDSAQKATAIYAVAVDATDLMAMLNQEVTLHGRGQQELLDEAVAVAAEHGIDIRWSEDHQRYFYTGEAYRQYLQLVPDGVEATNSRYHLIETGFYLGDSANREEMAARAEMESDFLRRYPEFGDAGRVAMFLAIDYRDLWRVCQAAADVECADRYARLNRDHLKAVAKRYKDEKTGELAGTLLQRFEAEIAGTP